MLAKHLAGSEHRPLKGTADIYRNQVRDYDFIYGRASLTS